MVSTIFVTEYLFNLSQEVYRYNAFEQLEFKLEKNGTYKPTGNDRKSSLIASKEILRPMFCLLAAHTHLFCVEVIKKGCQCTCPVERKVQHISVIDFLYFNSKMCKRLPKKL